MSRKTLHSLFRTLILERMYENQAAVLKEILDASPGAQGPLPPLLVDTTAWDEFWRKIGEIVENFFKGFHFNLDSAGIGSFVRPAIYLVLAILFISIVYMIFKRVALPSSIYQENKSGPITKSESFVERLAFELDKALAKGDFALAGRLRWKLFLYRKQKKETATPLEIFGSDKFEKIASYYDLMFGDSHELSLYKSFDDALKNFEVGAR